MPEGYGPIMSGAGGGSHADSSRAADSQLDHTAPLAPPKAGRACLVVSTGEAAGTVFQLTQPAVLIGRSTEAKVRINEHAISASHALIEVEGGTVSLRDLGSTNGTFVNGQRIVQKVVLSGGDTIQAGSTTFLFLARDSSGRTSIPPDATLELGPPVAALGIESRSRRPSNHAPAILVTPEADVPASMSLTDVVTLARRYWAYVRRNWGTVAVLTLLGAAGGVVHTQLKPPPGSAWFEMKLVTGPRAEDAAQDFSAGAENTFRSLPLIKRALTELGTAQVTDASANYVQSQLSFKRTAYNSSVYRGEYDDVSAERAAEFLRRLLDIYIDSELDKLLSVLKVDAEFDRTQEEQAKQAVGEARSRLVTFSDAHPEAVPKDTKLPEPAPVASGARPSPERTEQSIATKERELYAAYQRIQKQKAAPYLEQATVVDNKIAEARARGLKDKHPELASLLTLQATLRGQASTLLAAEPSANERAADPEIGRLQTELAELRARRGQRLATPVSPRAPAAANRPVVAPSARAPAGSLAQLRIEYSDLASEYERAKAAHKLLLDKREATERQLERERTSAKARFDIISPPTPLQKPPLVVIAKRAVLGAALGFVLAVALAAYRELRRQLIARGHI